MYFIVVNIDFLYYNHIYLINNNAIKYVQMYVMILIYTYTNNKWVEYMKEFLIRYVRIRYLLLVSLKLCLFILSYR